jgi:hypothetical protein
MSQGAASVFPLGIWLSKVHKERSTQGRRWPPVEARNSRAPERHKKNPNAIETISTRQPSGFFEIGSLNSFFCGHLHNSIATQDIKCLL